MRTVDVAVIGAGIAGLSCAQQLHQAGLRVIVVEKSRGLGGRVATRRIQSTCADHGACYISPKTEILSALVTLLVDRGLLTLWTDTVHQFIAGQGVSIDPAIYPRYVAPDGMTAIAKFLATGLEIHRNQRVVAITRRETWQLQLEETTNTPTPTISSLAARMLVMAIPAPQALLLLEPLAPTHLEAEFIQTLAAIKFAPSITVMAGYAAAQQQKLQQHPLPWRAVTFTNDADLAWIGWDSSKRQEAHANATPLFVIQSSASFAHQFLEEPDLTDAGHHLLVQASDRLLPWLKEPIWSQTHRWRYAFVTQPLQADYLASSSSSTIVCCGDWCPGGLIDAAVTSGLAAAQYSGRTLEKSLLADGELWNRIYSCR